MTQHEDFFGWSTRREARVAISKTSSTPSPVKALHSKYFLAPICLAIDSASLGSTKCELFLRTSSIASGLVRKSFLSPTRTTGVLGHRLLTSSIHFVRALSRLSGVSTAKPIRMV